MSRIVVIRHGHREKYKHQSFGNDVELTMEGKAASSTLGSAMKRVPLGEVHTSPLTRCVQTAQELLKGSGQKSNIISSKVLGDPGPFIIDPIQAGPLFLQHSLQDMALAIVKGEKLPGIRSLEEGGLLFLNYISQVKRFPCLMISHDIIICLLLCFFFKSKEVNNYMPDFLEGFTMNRESGRLFIHYGDEVCDLKN